MLSYLWVLHEAIPVAQEAQPTAAPLNGLGWTIMCLSLAAVWLTTIACYLKVLSLPTDPAEMDGDLDE